VVCSSETHADESFQDIEKGPMMVLVYGMPGFVRVARAASIPIDEPMGIAEVVGHFTEAAPPITITRAEYDEAMAAVAPFLGVAADATEEGWRRFAWIRSNYEPAVRALAGLTFASPALWTTDRAAKVGRPRFLRRRVIQVDWTVNVPGAAVLAPPALPASPTGG
jgi:hypothetical protein